VRTFAVALAAALLASCSRSDPARLPETGRPAPAAFDWDHPAAALDLSPEDVAARLGSFDWAATVEWTIERQGADARRVHVVEHHRVRQTTTGEFDVHADLDPGMGPGTDTGKEIAWTGGMTYARARYAPWRERPTDRGRDARRYRDDSFLAPRTVARLVGPGLEVRPAGDGEALRRPARRLTFSLTRARRRPTRRSRRPTRTRSAAAPSSMGCVPRAPAASSSSTPRRAHPSA
jgi:hypothetical protein